jgi:hypothetical protein
LRIVVGQIATLPAPVAGITILVRGEVSDGSLYWIVPGFLASFALAFLDAWVLLVEINR